MSLHLVKIQKKGQVVIPRSLREQVGVAEGDLMEIEVVEGGRFLFTPKVMINRGLVTGKKNRKPVLADLAAVVEDLRQEAKAKGLDKMTMREINAEVEAYRRQQPKNRTKQPTK
jgi:AbrB family looped-hinge helix DNA binding protein